MIHRTPVKQLHDAAGEQSRSRLRKVWRGFHAALDAVPRNQAAVEKWRSMMPRPVGDRDFWDLVNQ